MRRNQSTVNIFFFSQDSKWQIHRNTPPPHVGYCAKFVGETVRAYVWRSAAKKKSSLASRLSRPLKVMRTDMIRLRARIPPTIVIYSNREPILYRFQYRAGYCLKIRFRIHRPTLRQAKLMHFVVFFSMLALWLFHRQVLTMTPWPLHLFDTFSLSRDYRPKIRKTVDLFNLGATNVDVTRNSVCPHHFSLVSTVNSFHLRRAYLVSAVFASTSIDWPWRT